MIRSTHLPPKVERNGNVRIITFDGGAIRDVQNRLARELEGMTEGLGADHLLLDFTNVESVGSEELGTIVALHKQMTSAGGHLTLFNLNPRVYAVFEITRLHTLVRVCREDAPDRKTAGQPAASGRAGEWITAGSSVLE